MDNMDTYNDHHFPDRLTWALVDLQRALDSDPFLDRHVIASTTGLAVTREVAFGFEVVGQSSAFVADYRFDFHSIELADGWDLPYRTWDLDPDDYIKVEPNSDELQDGFMLTQLQGIGWTLQAGWDA